MKKIILIAVAFLLSVPVVSAQSKKKTDTKKELSRIEAQIADLEERIAAVDLEINRLIWEKHLERSEQGNKTISISAMRFVDPNAICDSVPHLGELYRQYKAIDAEYKALLATDPEYESIRRRWVAAGKDGAERPEIQKEYNLLYERMERNDPEYLPLRQRLWRANSALNVAVVRWVLDFYQVRGEIMPTDNVIPAQELHTIRTLGEIPALTEDANILKSTRRKLKQKHNDLLYGIVSNGAVRP